MTANFDISAEWFPGGDGAPEIRQTVGLLQIAIGGKLATRNEDAWSQSVRKEIRVSAYPLALWLASSWWRLRWEPKPKAVGTSWRMAHQMAAAGYGYLWPRLTLASDGESIEAVSQASDPGCTEPVRYLADFREVVGAADFERSVDRFMDLTLARLDATGVSKTELFGLWTEVLEERADADLFNFRKLEAQLGFDPDDAPAELMRRLADLACRIGKGAVGELAPVCAGDRPDFTLGQILEFGESRGTEGHIEGSAALSSVLDGTEFGASEPWVRGGLLAEKARRVWGLGTEPVSDARLAEVVGVPHETFERAATTESHSPAGLAIRDGDDLRLLFHRKNRPGRRFEASRFIADHLASSGVDRWLLAADTGTARQKLQRAFAVEFLCPFDALEEFLAADYSAETIEDAGDYFGVSGLAVKSHLANHGRIPYDAVAA